MESLEPLINLLILLTVLSVSAERLTNLLKLRRSNLRIRSTGENEILREYSISLYTISMGIILAILVKADFFEILTHLENPWQTLGWVKIEKYHWIKSTATASIGAAIYAVAGCVLTGIGLGFGSKFWHDILEIVYDIRIRRNVNTQISEKSDNDK
jgi:hypothetical protein